MDVFNQVRAQYVNPVDDHTLIKGAIDGMLAALDPHSSYMEGSDYTSLKTTTDGNYGGLGLSVTMEDGAVKVITPTEDTPADKAGMKAGEYGATRIYAGQLAVLAKGSHAAHQIARMARQEQRHLDRFDALLAERKVRPTALQ